MVSLYELAFFLFKVFNPNIESCGRLFNHAQCPWRKIKLLGLETVCKTEPSIKIIFNQFLNSPSFNITRIREAYKFILRFGQGTPEKLFFSFFNYFEDTFDGKKILINTWLNTKFGVLFNMLKKY